MNVRYDYSDKVVFVTGGTSGIGRAAALAFARAGAHVVVAARDPDAGARTEELLRREGGRARFTPCDVRHEASVNAAVAAAVAAFGRLDVAINSAGVGGDLAPVEEASQAVWDDVMAVNVRGVWLAMRAELPAMLGGGGGAIVNLSSIYGLAGRPAHHAYVASKHAVIGLTRSVALEFATRNVRVNALCAGATRTAAMEAAERVAPEMVRALVAEHPLARLASEAEVAAGVLWLCSADAGFVTGSPLVVDGGFLAA